MFEALVGDSDEMSNDISNDDVIIHTAEQYGLDITLSNSHFINVIGKGK